MASSLRICRPARLAACVVKKAAVCLAALCLTLSAALSPDLAAAEVRRFALVVGANLGMDATTPLQYAVRDAERMAQVLEGLGGVAPERLVLLRDPDAQTLARVLADLDDRIGRARAQSPEDEVVLVFYYSGHADPQGLQLGGERVPFETLKEQLRASPAQLKVLILDACRAGEITRIKGAAPAEPFQLDMVERFGGEGMAIMTSAAADEDAQESGRLQGSFFTHHLVAGLLGAADLSGDQRVTLGEAYGYAYSETLRSTSSAQFIQHPTYHFEIRGQRDLVLTDVATTTRDLGSLRLPDAGDYMLFRVGQGGELASEVRASADTVVRLEAGEYLVRRREPRAVYEAVARVTAGGESVLWADEMASVPLSAMVRKGVVDDRAPMSVISGARLGGPLLDGGALTWGASIGVQVDWEALSLQARVQYGFSSTQSAFITQDQHLVGVDLTTLKLFDLGPLQAGFGLRVGADWIRQGFSTEGDAPTRDAFAGRLGPVLHLGVSPWAWLGFFVEGGGDAYLLPEVDPDSGQESVAVRFMPTGSVGVCFFVP